jgi:hypothetical protein
MQRHTLPPKLTVNDNNYDMHQLEIIAPNNILSMPIDPTTKGSQVLSVINDIPIEKFVISSKNPQTGESTPIYTSETDKKVISLIPENENFSNNPIMPKLIPNRVLSTRKQRFTIFVEPIDSYLFYLKLMELKKPALKYFKPCKKAFINVDLPYGTTLRLGIDKDDTIKHFQMVVYKEMQRIYGESNLPSFYSYRFGTADKKSFPDHKLKFSDSPEMMEAFQLQMRNPEKAYFAMVAVGRDTPFTETINKYAEELDLSLPQLTLETQALYSSLSKVRHVVENQRIERISVNPLLARMRTSNTDPPLFTCQKSTVAMRCELRAGITEVAATGTSIQVEYTVSADEAIKSLISKMENHQKICIGKDFSEFVLILQGTDEVIAGPTPLVEFICVRQFLISNQPVMNVLLAEKNQIIESIRNKELAVTPMKEPEEGDFVPSISVSDDNLCIPNLRITSQFSVFIKGFRNVPTNAKRIGCQISIINGILDLCDPLELPVLYGGIPTIICNRKVEFPLSIRAFPRTTRISITLYDVDEREALMKKKSKKRNKHGAIASMNYALFTHDGWINVGPIERAMWNGYDKDYILTTCESKEPDAVVVMFELPRFRYPVYHKVPDLTPPQRRMSTFIRKIDEERIEELEKVDPLEVLTESDRNLIWSNRARFITNPAMLPLVFQSLDYTCPSQVAEIPYILKEWADISPQLAITLLDAKFADSTIRTYAVQHLDDFNDSEIMLYMLQLVQALKYELYDDSELLRFLLRRGLAEPKFVGHQLFWQLMSEAHLSHIRERFSAIVVNFMYGIGSYRKELKTGYRFTQKLVELNADLCKLSHTEATKQFRIRLQDVEIPEEFHLPMDPRLVVDSFIIDKCKVMNSKKKPFSLAFRNAAPFATEPVYTLFKVGDDLRQDQLTLQIMKVMEHLWRENQLDLRMNCYSVLPTGFNQGFIQIVTNSITEQALQQKNGKWTGVFKTNTMKDFLLENNSTDVTYNIAKENFLLSSSGYAVSSCVLGVTDRHPGNIMVQRDGHFFHIDFGHFLGNFKKKLGYQREDAPYHFSPACAEVLDGVGSETYERFETINGQAFNILRRNANLLISMMLLMLGTGIPELQKPEDINYMKEMLSLESTEEEAVEVFREYTRRSLESTKTALNNWIHNLVVS